MSAPLGALRWTVAGLVHAPWRAALGVGTVAAATALVGLTLGLRSGYERALARNIERLGYQVLVTGKGCPHEAATLILRGGSIPMYISDEVADHVAAQAEVAQATRFLLQAVPGDQRGQTQLFMGVDEVFLALKPGASFQRGGWFSDGAAREVIAGYNVAEYRRLELGDEVEVLGELHRLVGVLDQLGTQDDGTIFLPLTGAQEVFEKRDRITGLGLRLHDLETADALMNRVLDIPSVQVVRLSQVQETVLGTLRSMRALLAAFAAAALAAAGLGVLGVTLLTLSEGGPDLALLRAMGARRGTLFRIAWSQALVLGLAGGLAGAALAVVLRGVAESVARAGLGFVPAGTVVTPSVATLALSAALALATALLVAILPAWRAARGGLA